MRFRKSKSFGPFRVSLTKSGLSASVGVKGLRVTKTSSGKTRLTASIPGTGISYVKDVGKTNPAAISPSCLSVSPSEAQAPPQKFSLRANLAPILGLAALALCLFVSLFSAGSARRDGGGDTATRSTSTVVTLTDRPTATPAPTLQLPLVAVAAAEPEAETPEPSIQPTPATTPSPTAKPTPQTSAFVLNTSTKKFHRPGCKSIKKMAEKNKKTLEATREEIIAQGYDPCDICKP